MPLPVALTTCVLTGTYLASDGTALAGQVSFIPTSALTDAAGSVVVSQTPVAARLQAGTGSFSITLPCTDNADLSPEGWQWQAVIQIPGATTTFFFLLPSTLGGTADISALTPAGEPPPATSTYVSSINGQAGAITLAVGSGIVPPAGDIGGSTGSPTVTSTHLASALPVAQGGTGATSAGAALTSLGAASSTALAAETSRAETAEGLLAPLASPALTGSPTAPTQTTGDNSTKIATDAFVTTAVATETTRAEAAEALKAPLASPALTGSPTAPTQTTGDASTKIATDAFVSTAVAVETTRAETAEALLVPLSDLPLSLAHGGTGQASQQAAINALTGSQSAGKMLRSDGTNATLSAIQAGDVPTLNQNTTGSAGSANALNSATTTVGVSAATAPTSGQVLTATSGTAATWQTPSSGFSNPMTTLGDIIAENSTPAAARIAGNTTATKNFLTQTGTGSVSALPSWGTIAAGDVPTLNQSTTGTAAGLSSTLAITSGGTGQVTQQAAINALTGTQSAGKVLRSDGTNATLSTIQAADVPTLNQSTTGTAANVTGTVAIANGGTGQVSQQAALNALAGVQTSGDYLRGNGTNVSMSAIQAADVPTLNQSTSGTAAGLSSTLAIASGGTGQVTAGAAYTALSPMTTLGDLEYEGSSSALRLAGPTSAVKNFLTSTGTGSAAAAPAWGTLAAGDLPAATTSAQGAVILDGTAGDIRATSAGAAAGSSTKAAAADHVHLQSFAGSLGDGSDGAVTLDGSTSYTGFSSRSGSTYTLTRDMFATTLTVNNSCTLSTNGYRVYCTGTLTNNGTISHPGSAGQANGTAGTASASNVSFHAGLSGGAGNTGAGGAGSGITSDIGAASSGAGGTGSSGAAGAAATNTGAAATQTWLLRSPAVFATGTVAYASSTQQVCGGCGGGGGGGDGTNKGGGGGGGAGVLGIAAASIVNNGTISAAGGAGGTPATGNCGGGGGGGGGIVWTFSLAAPTGSGSMTAAFGAAGSGVGSGTAGSAGSAGTVLNVVLA